MVPSKIQNSDDTSKIILDCVTFALFNLSVKDNEEIARGFGKVLKEVSWSLFRKGEWNGTDRLGVVEVVAKDNRVSEGRTRFRLSDFT